MQRKKAVLSFFTATFLVQNIYAKETIDLQNMIVTAQKTEQNIQKVPISMTLINEYEIEDKNINTLKDIGKFTPNVMTYDTGIETSVAPSIRGLFAEILTLESAMGVFIDGVPITMGSGLNDSLMDIERIEILKGPQGTLYGKNTEAGAINIISKKPSNQTTSDIKLKLGSDNLQEYSFKASGAIIKDKFYIGIGAKHYEKDGFITNTRTGEIVDDREHNYGKLHLRATPNDKLDISFIKSKLKHKDGSARMGSSFMPNRTVQSDLQGKNESSNDMNSLKVTYDISNTLKLESITTYRKHDSNAQDDLDFSSNPITKTHYFLDSLYKKTSQELRVSSTSDKFDWLVGLYGDKVKNKMNEFIEYSFMPEVHKKDLDGDSLGVFVHSKYSFNDKIKFIAGVRYDDEEKTYDEPLLNISLSNKYSEVSPKLAFEYHNTPKIMSYLTIAKGYRAGGFNPYTPIGYPKVYDKESLWSYDLGVKSSLLEDKLVLNTNIYYMDISDMQVTANLPSMSRPIAYTSNAAKATSKGVEIDFKGIISETFNIFGGLGINEIKYDQFKDALGDYSGNYNKYAPKYNYNLGISYRDQRGIFAQIDTNGYGKMYINKQNSTSKDAYSLVNTKIGYEQEDFDIYLYANNLFDKKYDTLKYAGIFDTYSKPREIGFTLNYRF